MKQYYDRLFLKEGSSTEEVKIAYKKLAKKFHPDINQNDDYIEEFKIIQEAYDYLISNSETKPKGQQESPKTVDRKSIYDNFNFSEYEEEIIVENFVFKIAEIKYLKIIGTNSVNSTADGIYFIIKLEIKNTDNQTRILSFVNFPLYDEEANCFNPLGQEIYYLGVTRKEMLFEKECQPQLTTFGYLLFEVPEEKEYFLELHGGKTDGRPSYTKKIISLNNAKKLNEN